MDDQDKEYLAFLIVRNIKTHEEAGRVGLSHIDDRYVERVMSGMLINMGEDYYIDDSDVDRARAAEKAPQNDPPDNM